jgi:hypothetical protein
VTVSLFNGNLIPIQFPEQNFDVSNHILVIRIFALSAYEFVSHRQIHSILEDIQANCYIYGEAIYFVMPKNP